MVAGVKGIEAGRAYVKLFGDDTDLEKTLKSARLKLRNFAGAVEGIGQAMLVAGAAVGAPLAAATKVYADFSQQMASVATMLDRPAEYLGKFGDAILRMSVEFAEGTDTLSKGLYQILSASIPPAKALGVLAVWVRAARAGMSDAFVAADAITTILNSYSMAAERAGEVSDWLFRIVRRGKTTFGELAPVMGLVAAPAAQAGINLDELGAVISTLTRAGLRTEVVMTALMNAIKSFLKPTEEAAGAARAIGIELNTATLRSMGLYGVLLRMSKLDPETIGRIFPNMRSLRGVLAAVQNIAGITYDLSQMQEKGGSTMEAYTKAVDNLRFRLDQMYQAGRVAAIMIGEKLSPLAEQITALLKSWAGALGNLSAWLVTGAAKIALFVGAIGAALLVVGKVTSTLTLLASPTGLWVAGLTAALIGVGYGLKKLNDAVTTTREEVKAAATEANRLTERYKELADKTNKTAIESIELESIISRLKDLFPELSDRIDGTAESIEAFNEALSGGKAGRRLELMDERRRLHELNRQWEIFQIRILHQEKVARGLPGHEGAARVLLELTKQQDDITAAQTEAMRRIHELRLEFESELAETIARAQLPAPATPAPTGPPPLYDPRLRIFEGRPATEAEKGRIYEAARLRLALIEDELVREEALIALRYDREIKKAQEAGEFIVNLEHAREAELEATRRSHAEKREREERRRAEEIADYERQIAYDLATEQVRATMEGTQQALALLALEREQALREAMEAGVGADALRALERTYNLRARALQVPEQRVSARGTFSGMATWGFGTGDSADRMTKATEKTADYVKRQWEWFRTHGIPAFS